MHFVSPPMRKSIRCQGRFSLFHTKGRGFLQFTFAASRIIAKSDKNTYNWLPLSIHLTDTAAVARCLWNEWLSKSVRDRIISSCGSEEAAVSLLVFLALTHDISKATPLFQSMILSSWQGDAYNHMQELQEDAGLQIEPYSRYIHAARLKHALVSQAILQNAGCDKGIASIVGALHGKPADSGCLYDVQNGTYIEETGGTPWDDIQQEYIQSALNACGLSSADSLPRPDQPAQLLLTGLLIMADWIASNTTMFPYIPFEQVKADKTSEERAREAFDSLKLPPPWVIGQQWEADPEGLFKERFAPYSPRPTQAAILTALRMLTHPGIAVLEAPMGCGKTEIALIMAELFALRYGCSGVYFALPTQATSNGIFPRVLRWADSAARDEIYPARHAVRLVHGAAQFNDDYASIARFGEGCQVDADENDSLGVHTWFEGRKKALLADFVVGTIDQLLMMALKQKHVMLRHLGLAGKVVVIDECHAYDAYMSVYLERALQWLGREGVPVIVLSATLPAERRCMLLNAYRNAMNTGALPGTRVKPDAKRPSPPPEPWRTSCAYPLLTLSDGQEVRQVVLPGAGKTTHVTFASLEQGALADHLEQQLAEGGCAGIIVNTVKEAQRQAEILRQRFGTDVLLLHSHFLTPDRIEKENFLMSRLGPKGDRPRRCIVVGSQVIEQSLDIDFDVMYTQPCPMDLLLQRLGREHRHERVRPKRLRDAKCFLLYDGNVPMEASRAEHTWPFKPDAGSRAVYGDYLLMRTLAFLPTVVTLPDDIPTLVQKVYGSESCPKQPDGYEEAREAWRTRLAMKQAKASKFCIEPPDASRRASMMHLLDTDVNDNEKQGEACVRDIDESFEVLVLRRIGGALHFLPWREGGAAIPTLPDADTARRICKQRLRLPAELYYGEIGNTIKMLEAETARLVPAWAKSPWLQGELLLLLDESLSAKLNGQGITYSYENGLQIIKEDDDGSEGV